MIDFESFQVLLNKDVDIVAVTCAPHMQAPIAVKALGMHTIQFQTSIHNSIPIILNTDSPSKMYYVYDLLRFIFIFYRYRETCHLWCASRAKPSGLTPHGQCSQVLPTTDVPDNLWTAIPACY